MCKGKGCVFRGSYPINRNMGTVKSHKEKHKVSLFPLAVFRFASFYSPLEILLFLVSKEGRRDETEIGRSEISKLNN